MKLTLDEVKQIKKEFVQEYSKTPYSQYFNGCGISTLKMQRYVGKTFDLKKGETLEYLCLSAKLSKQPAQKGLFPTEYKGLRVFYDIIKYHYPI